MPALDFEIVQRKTCFQGFYRLERITVRHALFAGGMSPLLDRELFVRHDATCVLPYDPVRDEIVLVEQFRVGAMDKSQSPWLLELVAGLIEENETPDDVAIREAQEEAGLQLTALWPITQYYPSPGGSNERVHLFLGRCDSQNAGGLHGLAAEGEDIRVQVLSFAQALEALEAGRLDNAASLIALQWLIINREKIRRQWA